MPADRFLSPVFHYTFAAHAPQLRVRPGQPLCVICPDSDNELSDGTLLQPHQRQRSDGSPLFEGNPMAGPIEVEGARAGDTLRVSIDAITLDRRKGQTGLAHGHGALPPHLLCGGDAKDTRVPKHLYEWDIDPTAGAARIVNPLGDRPIVIPLAPFIGSIGVCPPRGQAISTLENGVYGGNMDVPLTGAHSVVELPVFCDGGLLMMGDLHAAQGHGEIIGGGIETSGQITCTMNVRSSRTIPAPRFIDADSIAAAGVAGDLLNAIRLAYAHLLDWVVADGELNRWDAYNLISQTGSIVIGGLGCANQVVAARIPRSVLPAVDW